MSRAVVVNTDPVIAQRHAAALRAAGHEVETCAGPGHETCPVLVGRPCPIVDLADVLIYDAWVAGSTEAARELIEDLRETYADLPVVLTSADSRVPWVTSEGPYRVTPLVGQPTPQELREAVDRALEDQGMAV
jgi:DNA-binding NtrC family response regulator